MQLTQLLDVRSVLDTPFFQNEVQRVLYISWCRCWSHILSIIIGGFTVLQTSGLFKNQKIIKCVSITTITNYQRLIKKVPGFHDTNLNTLSTQTPRGQELLEHIKTEWQIKMMAVFFFIAHEKGFNFHAQPQTSAYSCYNVYLALVNPYG